MNNAYKFVLTAMQRHDVVLTLMRCCINNVALTSMQRHNVYIWSHERRSKCDVI